MLLRPQTDPHRTGSVAQAFGVIDTNSDGFITREDLREIMTSLCEHPIPQHRPFALHCVGLLFWSRVLSHNTYSHTDGRPTQLRTTDRAAPKEPTEAEISELMEAAPEGMDKINWIMFLTMFAEKMDGEPLPCL